VLEDLLAKKGENSRRFLNCVYTGNVDEHIEMLAQTGHYNLALLAAKVHKKDELIERIQNEAESNRKEIKMNEKDVEEIVSNSRAKVPLKSIFSKNSKECK
jgi:hypothetical protein